MGIERYHYQHAFTRWVILALSLLLAWAAADTLVRLPATGGAVAAALIIALDLALTARWIRAGVVIRDDSITYRGYLWSRTVSRHRIIEVTSAKWLRWIDLHGTARRTPLVVFWNHPRNTAGMDIHNDDVVLSIRQWHSATEPVAPPRRRTVDSE